MFFRGIEFVDGRAESGAVIIAALIDGEQGLFLPTVERTVAVRAEVFGLSRGVMAFLGLKKKGHRPCSEPGSVFCHHCSRGIELEHRSVRIGTGGGH